MKTPLTFTATCAFGLAFDVEKDPARKSGFRPAHMQSGSGTRMYGEMRLEGFAAALRLGLCKTLVMVGGAEKRYPDEHINRAEAIRSMLVEDCGSDPARIEALPSLPNTDGNLAVIKRRMGGVDTACVITSLMHVPRAYAKFYEGGLLLPFVPAEALWLAEGPREERKMELVRYFGSHELGQTLAQELQGVADMLLGTYAPRN